MLIVTAERGSFRELTQELGRAGLEFIFTSPDSDFVAEAGETKPDLVILGVSEALPRRKLTQCASELKDEMGFSVMALLGDESLSVAEGLKVDDFVVAPVNTREFALRIKRLLHLDGRVASSEVLKAGSLVLDLARCEVLLDKERLDLTYREYALLKFFMANKSRVFTREALLNKVWGFDYYGGDRTVDVHIRRLRSKIEKNESFIETVRNIGYRFRDDI
ncbi:MAG: response regulator transcription factor [Chloroflexota bacterium]